MEVCTVDHEPLLDEGQTDNYGLTLLSTAIKDKKEISCIQMMVNDFLIRCDDVDFATNMFEELTSTCAYWRDSDRDYFSTVLKDLIARGVNIDEAEFRKRLVRTAIKSKNVWLFDFLREMGTLFVGLELKNGKNLIGTIAEQMDYKDESSFVFCQQFVNLLVGSGYDLNSLGLYDETSLQAAIDTGKFPMVRMLIESGVDLNRRDKCGRTALHHALMIGKPLDSAVEPSIRPCRTNRLELIHYLSAIKSSRSFPLPYSYAAEEEATMIIELLLKNGVDVNSPDSMLNTPLHYAVFGDSVKKLEQLLECNVDVNAKNNNGNTPLQLILVLRDKLTNSVGMMKLLLKKGACPNVRNTHMETPLELALLFDTRLAEELLRYNADANDANVRQLLRELRDDELDEEVRFYYSINGTVQCMRRHWMKLMAANLPIDDEYKKYLDGNIDEGYFEQCSTEIEELKKVLIDEQQSLYDFLHMHPGRRCTYLESENLQQIVNSPNFVLDFPKISVLVMAGYQEARILLKTETI